MTLITSLLLGLLAPAAADWYTYPAKSVNLDKAFDPVWYKGDYTNKLPAGTDNCQGVHGIETAEGSLVACGKCDEDKLPAGCTDPAECGLQQAYVVMTDSNGNFKWGWQSKLTNKMDVCNAVADVDDGLLVVGYRQDSKGNAVRTGMHM